MYMYASATIMSSDWGETLSCYLFKKLKDMYSMKSLIEIVKFDQLYIYSLFIDFKCTVKYL